jgi:hypothetical protein
MDFSSQTIFQDNCPHKAFIPELATGPRGTPRTREDLPLPSTAVATLELGRKSAQTSHGRRRGFFVPTILCPRFVPTTCAHEDQN